jgi:hypothetical protein
VSLGRSLHSLVDVSEGHSHTRPAYFRALYSFSLTGYAIQRFESVCFYSQLRALLIYLIHSCDALVQYLSGLIYFIDRS